MTLGSLREALRRLRSELMASPQEADAVLTIVEDSTGQRVLGQRPPRMMSRELSSVSFF